MRRSFAVKSFIKRRPIHPTHFLLLMDTTTAVSYINKMGGTRSVQLLSLTKDLWSWCLANNIRLSAQHIPGRLNTIADEESRTLVDRSDWILNRVVFAYLDRLWGPLSVDLFASRLSNRTKRFFSWRPDPLAEATDAFSQDWGPLAPAYAHPPWC